MIRSPITGRTGNLIVNVGNLVTANSTELITIAQVQPVYVAFSIPSVHLPEIKRHLAEDRLGVVATPRDGDAPQPTSGTVTFADNAVDTTTQTIELKATFSNVDHGLWPGALAHVTLQLATLRTATVVPSRALQTGQDGQFVFVVKPDSTVERRLETTGRKRVHNAVVISKGLEPGRRLSPKANVSSNPVRAFKSTKKTTTNPGKDRGAVVPDPRGRPPEPAPNRRPLKRPASVRVRAPNGGPAASSGAAPCR